MLEVSGSHKPKFITKLTQSDGVRFYWCLAAADFEDDDEAANGQIIVELLFSVRVFTFASGWVEKSPPKEIHSAFKEALERFRNLA